MKPSGSSVFFCFFLYFFQENCSLCLMFQLKLVLLTCILLGHLILYLVFKFIFHWVIWINCIWFKKNYFMSVIFLSSLSFLFFNFCVVWVILTSDCLLLIFYLKKVTFLLFINSAFSLFSTSWLSTFIFMPLCFVALSLAFGVGV